MSGYNPEEHCYDDILQLPHHQSKTREHMSLHDRAAQFAPFSALNGYEDAIEETGRLTEERIMLDSSQIEEINEKLHFLMVHLEEHLTVSVTYFQPDDRKSGGAYLTDIGVIRKIDETGHFLVMDSGSKILMERITAIQIVGRDVE